MPFITPFRLRNAHFAMPDITMMLLAFGAIGFVSNFVTSLAVKRSLVWSTAATVVMLMLTLLLLPLLRHSEVSVIALVCAWGMAFGAIPLCGSLWSQHAAPDLPEAGSALLISTVQVAIALGVLDGRIDRRSRGDFTRLRARRSIGFNFTGRIGTGQPARESDASSADSCCTSYLATRCEQSCRYAERGIQ